MSRIPPQVSGEGLLVIRTAQKSLSEHFRHVLQLLIGLVTTMM